MQTRRVFLGSTAVAGAGAIAAGGAFLLQTDPTSAQEHRHLPAGRIDPMFELFVREAAAIRQDIKRRFVRGEHARRQAAAVRMLATYGGRIDVDARVRSAVRQQVRRSGRETILQAPVDYQRMVARLRAQGISTPEDLPDPNLLTYDQRAAGLDELLRNGITPLLNREAALLDRAAPGLDRFGSLTAPAIVPVRLQEQDEQEVSRDDCILAWQMQLTLKQAAGLIFCFNPLLWDICLLFEINILGLQAASMYFCSDNP